MTHAQVIRQKINDTRDLVLAHVNMAKDVRMDFFYKMGEYWAQNFTICENDANELLKNPEYWSFWEMEWQRMEEMFLELISYHAGRNEYFWQDPETGLRVWCKYMLFNVYLEFMDKKINECEGNAVIMSLTFQKRVKNGKRRKG